MGVERANTLEKEDFFLGRSRLQSNFSVKWKKVQFYNIIHVLYMIKKT